MSVITGSHESILFDKQTSDATIKTADASIFAHKAILVSQSPVFKALFDAAMEESKTSLIQIDDFSTKVIEELLRSLYTHKIDEAVHQSIGSDLMRMAGKYQCLEIKDSCAKYLSTHVTNQNAIEYLQLGELVASQVLIDACVTYITKNFPIVDRHEQLVSLVKPETAQALLGILSSKIETWWLHVGNAKAYGVAHLNNISH